MNHAEIRDYFATAATRDKERTRKMLDLDRELMKLQVAIQDARRKFNALLETEHTKSADSPAPAKSKRAGVTVDDDDSAAVFNALEQLSDKSPEWFSPSTMKGATGGVGLKTISAACKRLVVEGRATEKRGAYRIAPAAPYDGSEQ